MKRSFLRLGKYLPFSHPISPLAKLEKRDKVEVSRSSTQMTGQRGQTKVEKPREREGARERERARSHWVNSKQVHRSKSIGTRLNQIKTPRLSREEGTTSCNRRNRDEMTTGNRWNQDGMTMATDGIKRTWRIATDEIKTKWRLQQMESRQNVDDVGIKTKWWLQKMEAKLNKDCNRWNWVKMMIGNWWNQGERTIASLYQDVITIGNRWYQNQMIIGRRIEIQGRLQQMESRLNDWMTIQQMEWRATQGLDLDGIKNKRRLNKWLNYHSTDGIESLNLRLNDNCQQMKSRINEDCNKLNQE